MTIIREDAYVQITHLYDRGDVNVPDRNAIIIVDKFNCCKWELIYYGQIATSLMAFEYSMCYTFIIHHRSKPYTIKWSIDFITDQIKWDMPQDMPRKTFDIDQLV